VLRVKAVAERMGHDLVRQNPLMPCPRYAKHAVSTSDGLEYGGCRQSSSLSPCDQSNWFPWFADRRALDR
jgi:hypothetical protein